MIFIDHNLTLKIAALLLLILFFTSGCASPAVPYDTPFVLPPIGSGPESESQISAPPDTTTPLDIAFAAAEEGTQAAEALANMKDSTGIPILPNGMPRECDAVPERERRHCWHAYVMESPATNIILGQPCDYDFQCDLGLRTRSCKYGVDKERMWEKRCTLKLPEENE